MNFPKKIMRKNELVREMGMSERKLKAIYRTRGQTVAKKLNPGVRNSPIIFDTYGCRNIWIGNSRRKTGRFSGAVSRV